MQIAILIFSVFAAIGTIILFWIVATEGFNPYGYYQCSKGHQTSSSQWHRRHCTQCGEKMRYIKPRRCANGHKVRRGEKFCSRCGNSRIL